MIRQNSKVFIVGNEGNLGNTLESLMSGYFKRNNLYAFRNFNDAFLNAEKLSPKFVIVSYDGNVPKVIEFFQRLRASIDSFFGFIVYYPESKDYEEALKEKILTDPGAEGIILTSYEDLFDRIESLHCAGQIIIKGCTMGGKFKSQFYAGMLIEAADDGRELCVIRNDLSVFSKLVSNDRDLMVYLNSPGISKNSKKMFVRKSYSSEMSGKFVNFLGMLIENNSQSAIVEINSIVNSEPELFPVN